MKKSTHQPPILHLSDFLTEPQRFLVARAWISPRYGPNSHRHDFAEFFWINTGSCGHGFQGGREILHEGDIRFVRPEHAHEFRSLDATGARLTNIALPAEFISAWARAYPSLQGRFFWSTDGQPDGFRLTPERVRQLEQAADDLALDTADLLALHHLMMRLFLDASREHPHAASPPLWLKRGIDKLPDIAVFSAGVGGFVKACGRSPEHVSRATRKHLGTTPGELVNSARMSHAAQQLRMSDDNILDIMMDCGLNNPSHFYALFRKHYGETPRQYRMRRHGLVWKI